MAELDDDPAGPDTLVGWIAAAVEAHSARSAAERAALSGGMPADDAGGFQKVHQMTAATFSVIEVAIAEDRRSAGRILSRSAWVREAAYAAAVATQLRHGGSLPEAPERLTPGPPRRR